MRSTGVVLLATVSIVGVLGASCTLTRSGSLSQACTIAAECALPNGCYAAECASNGTCVLTPVDNSGSLEQVAGDCLRRACEVDGGEAAVVELPEDDPPVDEECVAEHACADGDVLRTPITDASMTSCRGGDGICEGGECVVECDALDDPRCDDANGCTTDVCNLAVGRCENDPEDNTAVSTQTDGDCALTLCVAGVEVTVHDDVDLPDDAEACTSDSCYQGQAVHTAVTMNTACTSASDPLAGVCNGNGQCVQCNGDAQCIGFMPGFDDTDCKTPMCTAGVCELDTEPLGVIAANQSSTPDCHTVVCNGNGGYLDQIDDTDVPDDANDCTGDACQAGVPMHPNDDADTSCGTGGLCDGNGSCGQCNLDSHCQADTFCRDHACNTAATPNQCTFTNVNQGVDLPAQLDGDCHTLRCNAGVSENQIDDNDLPSDTGECTQEVCTGGVPTHPPEDIDFPCTESSGFFCDGDGNCVECNDDSQCSDGDDICESDDCAMNGCTVVNHDTSINAPPAFQTAMNCQVVKCDGMGDPGASVPDDADIHDDDNACTADSCSLGSPVHDPAPLNGTLCTPDALFCNGPERCNAGACGGSGDPCLPLNLTDASCNGSCDEDANACTAYDGDGVTCVEGVTDIVCCDNDGTPGCEPLCL